MMVCTVRTVLVKLRCITVIVTPYFTVITVKYGTVYGTVPSGHCQCKNDLRMASSPQNLPFSPVCSSHVLTPHIASLNDPEAGLGLHQLGGWHCQCNFGLRMVSPPQHLPFSPPACSSHVLTPHNASLNDPEAGLASYISSGEGPSDGLHGHSKVGRST